eukprot:CAMPEP_0174244328 /NCGR_PEP_ID=MMETSP0417-20130205/34944_1 /TAXON_ID=242541 /ORGANISM="Mayorella sp, Strain BSH-02190019" /LENGTH=699 /DNA_ID=CAMNT_0015324001 /DNA_START=33 /DNA_END=2129 /DNA_ORIENTATION=+
MSSSESSASSLPPTPSAGVQSLPPVPDSLPPPLPPPPEGQESSDEAKSKIPPPISILPPPGLPPDPISPRPRSLSAAAETTYISLGVHGVSSTATLPCSGTPSPENSSVAAAESPASATTSASLTTLGGAQHDRNRSTPPGVHTSSVVQVLFRFPVRITPDSTPLVTQLMSRLGSVFPGLELGAVRHLHSSDSLQSLSSKVSLSADTPGRKVESFHHGDALVADLSSASMLESLMSPPPETMNAEDTGETSDAFLSPRSKMRLKKSSFHRKISPRVRAQSFSSWGEGRPVSDSVTLGSAGSATVSTSASVSAAISSSQTLEKKVHFPAEEEEEEGGVKPWKLKMQRHREQMRAREESRVFGVPLAEVMARHTRDELIPSFVYTIIEYLRRKDIISQVGLFRLAGSQATILELRKKIDAGETIDPEAVGDPFSLGAVFKLWLRQLPEPLMTVRFYDRFLSAESIPEKSLRLAYYRSLVASLPEHNRNLLRYTVEFLRDVSQHADENKMTATNLATVVGPNILVSKEDEKIDNNMDFITTMTRVTSVIQQFIEEYDELFVDDAIPFKTYRALNAYAAKDANELTIQVGNIIHVFRKEDEVWYGEIDGRIGSFPHAALQRRRRAKSFHIGRGTRTTREKRPKDGDSVATKTLPTGFTPKKAEMYLTDDEFEQLFHIKRSAYLKLPAWKQAKLKEKAGFGPVT